VNLACFTPRCIHFLHTLARGAGKFPPAARHGQSIYTPWFIVNQDERYPDRRRHQEASAAGHRTGGGAVGRLQAPQGINPEGKVNMALTRDFKETVAARVQNDPAFAQAPCWMRPLPCSSMASRNRPS
jgi:hypothetical protein